MDKRRYIGNERVAELTVLTVCGMMWKAVLLLLSVSTLPLIGNYNTEPYLLPVVLHSLAFLSVAK